jgi:hypothetical protein
VLERQARAAVPSDLAKAMAAAAARITAGEALAVSAPMAAAALAGIHLRTMMMRQCWVIAGLMALGITTTVGVVGLATAGGDESKAAPQADDRKLAAKAGAEHPDLPLAEKLERLKAEFESANRAFQAFYRGSTIPKKDEARAAEVQPDFPAFVRRVFDLAATAPQDPAARDAMLWIVRKGLGGSDSGPHAGEFAMAATWLIRHFGDDPDAVRVALNSTQHLPPTATTCC